MSKTRATHLKIQLDMLQKLFLKANVDPLNEDPWEELERIDWGVLDSNLTLAENLHILKEKYSDCNWDLYASVDEILADELSNVFEAEVKPVEQKVKGKTYRQGRVQITLPEWTIGSKVRIVHLEPLDKYIKNWIARVRGRQMIGEEDRRFVAWKDKRQRELKDYE